MRKPLMLVVVGFVLVGVTTAQAGFAPTSHVTSTDNGNTPANKLTQTLLGQPLGEGSGLGAYQPAADGSAHAARDEGSSQIRVLPPAPESAALCLWALSGLGAWRLGRNARQMHLNAVPEWYARHAPQIGSTKPFDFVTGFELLVLPECLAASVND